MNRFITTPALLLLFALCSMVIAQEGVITPGEASNKQRKKNPAFAKVVDNPALPRVLIIGDSISIGYTAETRQNLKGIANVHRIPGNAGHTEMGLANLDKWLHEKNGSWDLIHFNWGLWDLCYRHPKSKNQGNRDKVRGTLTHTPDEYATNLEAIVARLKKTSATLVFATTTPVPEGEAGRKLGDDKIYNDAAMAVMKKHGVVINDLHAVAAGKMERYGKKPGDVHFTVEGYTLLAEAVARVIRAELVVGEKAEAKSLSEASMKRLMKEMIWVEGGTFTMGSNSEEASAAERPAHEVTLDGFHIGKFETGQELFEEVMGWNVSYFPDKGFPVNNISWWNIQLFLERLNEMTGKHFRLPTEAEWEYAAKGGNRSKGYAFSGSDEIGEVAWYAENSKNRPHPSGKKKPNELGLYDMTGNLWEYCHDEADMRPYPTTARTNPVVGGFAKPFSKKEKVTRGGGYEFAADESFVFRRDGATPNVRLPDIGFRLVMIEEPEDSGIKQGRSMKNEGHTASPK